MKANLDGVGAVGAMAPGVNERINLETRQQQWLCALERESLTLGLKNGARNGGEPAPTGLDRSPDGARTTVLGTPGARACSGPGAAGPVPASLATFKAAQAAAARLPAASATGAAGALAGAGTAQLRMQQSPAPATDSVATAALAAQGTPDAPGELAHPKPDAAPSWPAFSPATPAGAMAAAPSLHAPAPVGAAPSTPSVPAAAGAIATLALASLPTPALPSQQPSSAPKSQQAHDPAADSEAHGSGAPAGSHADPDAYKARHLHLFHGADGVQAWVRDAALSERQAQAMVSTMAGELGAIGARLRALTVNGQRLSVSAGPDKPAAPLDGINPSTIYISSNGAI